MKLIILAIFALLLIALGIAMLFGIFRTWKVQNNPLVQEFTKGKTPTNLNGLYKGAVRGLKTSWQGKKFDPSKSKGINIFRDANGTKERYPFKTYQGQGLQDNRDVLKIDYNLEENPLWLRFIVDELVETKPGKYLGKLHVRILPGISFALGYFELVK